MTSGWENVAGGPAGAGPARASSVREHNLGLVLAHVADHGPASRARVAAATGLTKATVSSLVDTLVAGGLLAELGPQASTGAGRPGSLVALAPAGPVGVGLEINVDYLATCTVDLAGRVRQRQLVADDFRRSRLPHALSRAATAVRTAVEEAQAAGARVAGVAVAVPGLVETDGALLRLAPNLGWRDVAVLDELRDRLGDVLAPGATMTLDNEANLAALAELWCGGHTGPDGGPLRTFVHVSGEIGVGAGIVVDGRLFRGARGFSGEIGHVPVGAPLDGPGATGVRPCSCGSPGCLEQVAGQEAILRAAGVRTADEAGTTTGAPGGPVEVLVARAADGDAAALAAIAGAGTHLGVAIAAVLNLVDADAVVLGGLYGRLGPWLREAVAAEVARRTLASAWAPVQVLVSRLGGEAAVRGAATSVVRGVIADPAAHLASR